MSTVQQRDAPNTTDALAPREIAARVESIGVAKARADVLSVLLLSILAGAFIALGGAFFTVVVTGSELGFGVTRLLGGVAFSLGLILVVVAGAELFTGNNLVAMAWASRLISSRELLRNWVLVYVGNVVGASATALAVWLAQVHLLGDGAVGETALSIGLAKAELEPLPAFFRGVLCNALVCLAVWLSLGGRSVTDKVLGVLFPITAFVALGLEHSIANWFFLPYAALLGAARIDGYASGCALNLIVVTAGNIVGGTVLVAAVYWTAYLRPRTAD
ncbi:formate/nitrite transporter family protein [Engelhardtia mirabilis]|uniref:Putative formate transporter 1 n=1 Tax=Engelhardtia mirabilis TaxID=2528011 RepID=A0A518BGJ7_9BACT|nr:putative formate transporter 1 [Planctomycetes bacterium Pla133]QDV00445.1 putative formate transporter 1 [Planctomycetes bacterium Pla86]